MAIDERTLTQDRLTPPKLRFDAICLTNGRRYRATEMGKKMIETVTFRTSKKQKLFEYCKAQGITRSQYLNQLIDANLHKNIHLNFATNKTEIREPTQRVAMRFKQSEFEALNEIIEHEGCTQQGFLIGLFRAFVASEVQYTTDEVLALREANMQLRKLGVNLNALVKELKKGNAPVDGSFEKMAEFITKRIEQHTQKVNELLNASEHRWKLIRKEVES